MKILFFVLLLCLPFHISNACGVSYYGEEYRVALLNPYVMGTTWSPFFYSANYLNHYQNEQNGSDRRRNCSEWAAWAGGSVTAGDVKALLYDASLDDVLNAIGEGSRNERFGENAFFKTLILPAKKAALDYLLFAKKYEHYSKLQTLDSWADDYWVQDEAAQSAAEQARQALKSEAKKQAAANADSFLRRRYAYQLMLMHRYAGERTAFEQLFKQYFEKDRSTVLADWALHHRAAMVSNDGERAYLYALSFHNSPEKSLASYQRFDKALVNKALAFAKNDREKAIIYALAEVKNPGRSLTGIQKVYTLDPTNQLLALLLTREISKLEDWLLTDSLTGMGDAVMRDLENREEWEIPDDEYDQIRAQNKQRDQAYLAELRSFLLTLIAGEKSSLSPDLLHLYAGHLFLMDKNGSAAARHLAAIGETSNPLLRQQKTTEEILLTLNTEDLDAPATQEKLAARLAILKKNKASYPEGKRDLMALNLLLSQDFERKGNFVAAFCLHNHALDLPTADRYDYGTLYYQRLRYPDWRATEKDLDAVLALVEKPGKTAFEKYLAAAPLPSKNALHDLRGTISFRKNDLQSALTAFSKVPQDFWDTAYEFHTYLDADPFLLLPDSTKQFPANKAAFVRRLLDLEAELASKPEKAAENHFLLGTAWFNCSYDGNSWMMFSYGNSISEDPTGKFNCVYCPKGEEARAVYYFGKRAKAHLQKAISATKSIDVKAKAELLLARMRYYQSEDMAAEPDDFWQWEYEQQQKFQLDREMVFYKDWVAAYANTAAFQEVTTTCPVLRTYFGK